jgi:RNA polymerase sigma-70 factor (ECF subfamily)
MSTKSNAGKAGAKSGALTHLDSLLRTALYMTEDEAAANNLIQETYMRAFSHWKAISIQPDIRTGLYKAMYSLLHERSHLPTYQPGSSDVDESLAGDQFAVLANEDIVVEDLCRDIGDDAIKNAIRELPPGLRLILILSFIEGFSYQEIAEISETDTEAVKEMLHGGRKLLQEIIWNQMIKNGSLRDYPAYC